MGGVQPGAVGAGGRVEKPGGERRGGEGRGGEGGGLQAPGMAGTSQTEETVGGMVGSGLQALEGVMGISVTLPLDQGDRHHLCADGDI